LVNCNKTLFHFGIHLFLYLKVKSNGMDAMSKRVTLADYIRAEQYGSRHGGFTVANAKLIYT